MEKKLSFAKNAAFNTAGTILYCFFQWATTMVAVKLCDNYDSVGIFQLAISITNIFYAISTYNMRTFQISDTENAYSNGDYIGMRIVTSGISVVLCILYSAVLRYPLKTFLCIAAYMLFKLNESFSDVYHGIDQRHYRMDYVGISHCIRGVVLFLAFTLTLKLSGDILPAIAVMAAATISILFLYDIRKTSAFGSLKPAFCKKQITSMLVRCLPMVIASSAYTAVVTVPRQFLESMCGESVLGYYATVATPIVVVQLLAVSVFNPLLTEISDCYSHREIQKVKTILSKTMGLLAVFGVVVFLGAALLGEFALTLLYGEEIRQYTYLMYAIIVCTILYPVCWMCSSLLTVIRKLKTGMTVSVIALGVSAALSRPFIRIFDMNGVSYCVIAAYLVFILLSVIPIWKEFQRVGKTQA